MIAKFKKVHIEGFLSIGEVDLDLDNQGTVYVTGVNNSQGSATSNGSGKSTIFESIIWVLTGSTLRGTTDVVNMYWKDYTLVTLTLQVDDILYEITRTRNHPKYGNNLKIKKNDVDISGDKLRKSESILAQELPQLTTSLISSVIILGQGLPNKFTDLSPSARKDRLEELSQSSEFIDELKVRLTNFIKLYNNKLSDTKVSEGKKETEISFSESTIKRNADELVELSNKSVDTNKLNTELSDLNSKIAIIDNNLSKLNDTNNLLNSKYVELSKLINDYKAQVQSKNYEISSINKQLNSLNVSVCPTCGQYISSPELVSNMKNELNEKLNCINNEIITINNSINSYDTNYNLISNKLQEIRNQTNLLNNDKVSCKGRIAEINSELRSVSDRLNKINSEIERLQNVISVAKSELKKLVETENIFNTKLGILDYLNKKSSKEFRGYLLIGVIKYLNSKLSYYGDQLFGTTNNLRLILDNNKLFIEYDKRPYENLSGGERQRADLAMQFSLRDMLINTLGFSCNLLVIDEGFDNLDESGVNSLINMINNMSSIDSVFTISHHTLSIPFDKTINVVKDINKVSTVSELI